jgi:hypothetical protein
MLFLEKIKINQISKIPFNAEIFNKITSIQADFILKIILPRIQFLVNLKADLPSKIIKIINIQ